MLDQVWARLSGREKLVAYATALMIAAHLVGLTLSNGYYAGDFADGGTMGFVAILAAALGLAAIFAREWPSGAKTLPASLAVILLAAGAVGVIIGLVLFTQVSGANSETVDYFRALHPTAAAAEIPTEAFVGPAGLVLGGLIIAFVGWRERGAAKKPGA
jgi:hypothetical protein